MGNNAAEYWEHGKNPYQRGSAATAPSAAGDLVVFDGTQYDNLAASEFLANYLGLSWKQPVRVATTTGGTLATSFAAGQTVDGVTLVTGWRILIKDQASAADNGIYVVNASGAPTRATDADSGTKVSGLVVQVRGGTINGGSIWANTNNSITLGSTALTFAQVTTKLKTARVTLTSAQVLALHTTPISLIAAPGAGFATIIHSVVATKAAGTAYADVATGDDLNLCYTNASGSVASTLEMTGFADSTSATITKGASAACLPVANAAIVADMTGDGITTGDSDFKLLITYETVPVPVF